MQTAHEMFIYYGHIAIGKLKEKGYILHSLDWDLGHSVFTLRIRARDKRPMVAVGLLTLRKKDSTIVLINAVTGKKTEFKMVFSDESNNLNEFLVFICEYAQGLREEEAYLTCEPNF